MKCITHSEYPYVGIRMMIGFGLIGMWGALLPMAESAEAPDSVQVRAKELNCETMRKHF